MTYDPNRERRVAEHQVLSAALTLAKLAGWSIDKHAPLLPKAFQDYLYVPETELLLVPSVGPVGAIRTKVNQATREARSDALIMLLGRNDRGVIQPYVSVGLWGAEQTRWYGPHMPWIYCDGEPWLLPDPHGGIDDQPCIRLSAKPLRAAKTRPWATVGDRYVGFARADAAFAHLQRREVI